MAGTPRAARREHEAVRRSEPRCYPPIGDYGVIGDGHTAALVSRSASIDFCCLPRFDSGSVFGRLLDWQQGGYWSFEGAREPLEPHVQRYADDTLVLVTELRSDEGTIRVTDLFAVDGRRAADGEHRELLRIVEGLDGTVRVRVRICPRLDYGELPP